MRYDSVVSRLFRIVRMAVLALLSSLALLAITLWAVRFLPMYRPSPLALRRTVWVSNYPPDGRSHIAIQHGDRNNGNYRSLGAGMTQGRFSIAYTWTSEDMGWTGHHWILGTGKVSWWQNSSKNGCKTIRAEYPAALAIPVLGAYPLLALTRAIVRRNRRRKPNECMNCSYDLTGNVSGTCPECGTNIKRATNREPETLTQR